MKIQEDIEKTLSVLLDVGDIVILHQSVLETWPDLKGYYTIYSIYKDYGKTYYSLRPAHGGTRLVDRALEHQLIKVDKYAYYEDTRRRRSDAPLQEDCPW